MMPMSRWIWVSSVAVVAASSVMFYWTALVGRPEVEVPLTGEKVADLSPIEAGAFAGDSFVKIRAAYVSSLRDYKRCSLSDVTTVGRAGAGLSSKAGRSESDPLTLAISGVVQAQLRAEVLGRSGLRTSAGGGNAEELSRKIAAVLRRAAGVKLSEYEPVNGRAELAIPERFKGDALQLLGLEPRDETLRPFSGVELGKVVADHFGRSAGPDSPDRIVKVGLDASSVRMCFSDRADEINEGALMSRMSADDQRLFRGYVSQAALIFWAAPAASAQELKKPVVFEAAFLVEDASGDRYPLWMCFEKRSGSGVGSADRSGDVSGDWWLTSVYRMVSIRALNRAPLVF